jgi:hypothetical protein
MACWEPESAVLSPLPSRLECRYLTSSVHNIAERYVSLGCMERPNHKAHSKLVCFSWSGKQHLKSMMGENESLGNESSMMEQRLGCKYISHNSHRSAILVPNTTLQHRVNVQQYNMVVTR